MDDLGGKLREALDETVGATAKRREAEEAFQQELAQARDEALAKLKRRWRSEREAAASLAQRRVREYARALSGTLKEALSRDGRMPVTINHLERYSAMKAIQDRGLLLARIEQTLGVARTAVERAGRLDPQGAVDEVAGKYREELAKVARIRVAPVEDAADEGVGSPVVSEDREGVLASLIEDADDAFSDDALTLDGGDAEGASRDERRDAFHEALHAAIAQADAAHAQKLALNARSAVGRSVELDDLEAFSGVVEVSSALDAGEVGELVGLVEASFRTYRQVVDDNGLFAAFSEGSQFGRCVGYASWMSAWDDWDAMEYSYDGSEYGGDPIGREFVRSRIPTAIEDVEEDGDSLQTAIARMREFNQRRYFGMLDDDFKQYVDAFWYGFGKLMEFANGMFEVDMRAYLLYCTRLADAAATRCGDLALLMDDGQLMAYCDELAKMRDAVRAGERG